MSLVQRDSTPLHRLNTFPGDNVPFIGYLKGIRFSLLGTESWSMRFSSLFESF